MPASKVVIVFGKFKLDVVSQGDFETGTVLQRYSKLDTGIHQSSSGLGVDVSSCSVEAVILVIFFLLLGCTVVAFLCIVRQGFLQG